jgi:tetratricopeptide (TPR) repeat protein
LALQRSGKYAEAAQCYTDAIERRPGFAEALLNLGHSLHSLGKQEQARECWAKAVEASPEFAAQYFA